MPTATSQMAAGVQVTASALFQGPLPHPQILRQYDELVPGSAKTFIDEFHAQSHHRQRLELMVIESDMRNSGRGGWFGFIGFLALVAASAVSGVLGHEGTAIALAGMDVVGFGSMYGAGLVTRHIERGRKASQLANPDPDKRNRRQS